MRSYKTYRTSAHQKRPLLRLIEQGLEAGGVKIRSAAAPTTAPFCYLVELPTGEELTLLIYAFRAKVYSGGEERPLDEHRFQIKYGSDRDGNFQRYHDVHISEDPSFVTLFLGVHDDEGVIVGCDPTMHNPTWFSKSVEFKDHHIESIREHGWYGWERDRQAEGRRKQELPQLNFQTEALVGFRPELLLRYISLERTTTGLDPGERLRIADGMAWAPSPAERHPLEDELGLSAREILDMIQGGFRLETAVRGRTAEYHLERELERMLRGTPDSGVAALDLDGRPDLEVRYRGRERLVTIECKNVLRKTLLRGLPKVDFQKTRAAKGNPCSRYYRIDHCDILAACLHPVSGRWEYRFREWVKMEEHPRCDGRLYQNVAVGEAGWLDQVERLIDEVSSKPRKVFLAKPPKLGKLF